MKRQYKAIGVMTVLIWLVLALAVSCQPPEVSGEQVDYSITAQGVVSQGSVESFTNAQGWSIELSRAQALVGPIYLYSGEARASLWQRALGINHAYACAAHAQFQSGRTLGEVPQQFGVDLLAGRTTLVEGAVGEGGTVQSVELHVQNPGQVEAGNEMAKSPEATYEFEGVATRQGVSIPFVASITLPEEGTHQIIDSIPAQVKMEQGSTLNLKVQLDRLFRDVDFSEFEGGESGELVELMPGTQAYSSMTFSLRARSAFVWEDGQ